MVPFAALGHRASLPVFLSALPCLAADRGAWKRPRGQQRTALTQQSSGSRHPPGASQRCTRRPVPPHARSIGVERSPPRTTAVGPQPPLPERSGQHQRPTTGLDAPSKLVTLVRAGSVHLRKPLVLGGHERSCLVKEIRWSPGLHTPDLGWHRGARAGSNPTSSASATSGFASVTTVGPHAAAQERVMKAIVQDGYGSPDVLE